MKKTLTITLTTKEVEEAVLEYVYKWNGVNASNVRFIIGTIKERGLFMDEISVRVLNGATIQVEG